MKAHECASNFYDFGSANIEDHPDWEEQANQYPEVSIFWDNRYGVYCRKIANVPGTREGNTFTPKHPLISYRQLNLPPCIHEKLEQDNEERP